MAKASGKIKNAGDKILKKGEEIVKDISAKNIVLDNLEALYIKELNDIYDAETQIIDAMPMMIKSANNPMLKKQLEAHYEQTKSQKERLTTVFELIGEEPSPKTCQGIKGILKEGEEIMNREASPTVKDAALIGSAQKVEHYEMASYGMAVNYAKILNETDAERILTEILLEEESAGTKLTDLAVKDLNIRAVEGV